MNSLKGKSKYSFHADRLSSALFASLWVKAWGDQYPVEVAPFSSCTNRLLHQLDQQLELNPDHTLVDLGCGTGGVGLWLAQRRGARLIGVDRCDDATSIATSRTAHWELAQPAIFLTGSFYDTGLPAGVANAVISIDALPAAQDIESALSEIRRVLQPNGVLVFTTRQLGSAGRHYEKLGSNWRVGLERNGFEFITCSSRPEVSDLWLALYAQWLEHENSLRNELQTDTVDALISEAREGIPKMSDSRPWYLIKAAASA